MLSPQEASERMRLATQVLLGIMVLEQESEHGNLEARGWLRQWRTVLHDLQPGA